MNLKPFIEDYLSKGGIIKKCPLGKRALEETDRKHLLNRGLFLLWQIIPVIGTGDERKPAKRTKGIKYKKSKRRSKWG